MQVLSQAWVFFFVKPVGRNRLDVNDGSFKLGGY